MIVTMALTVTMVMGWSGRAYRPSETPSNISRPIIYPMKESQLKAAPPIFGPDYYERLRLLRQLNEERRRIPLDYPKK